MRGHLQRAALCLLERLFIVNVVINAIGVVKSIRYHVSCPAQARVSCAGVGRARSLGGAGGGPNQSVARAACRPLGSTNTRVAPSSSLVPQQRPSLPAGPGWVLTCRLRV
jgi:hypothetical protein